MISLKEVGVPRQTSLSEIILKAEGCKSRNEARRLITQGGVKIDGKKAAADAAIAEPDSFVLQMGKHQFVRVKLT
jgi:tyrosyl-tRNA synthetase